MMLHCLNVSGGVFNGADLTVLEKQRASMKWQQQQGLQYSNMYSVMEDGVGNQFQAQTSVELSGLGRIGFPVVKPESKLDGSWSEYGNYGMHSADDFVSSGYANDSGTEYSYQMKKTASCPVSVIGESSEGKDSILTGKTRTTLRGDRESSKKRKADMPTSLKTVDDNDTKEKKIRECTEDGVFKITQPNRSAKNKNKGEASADSSKMSEVQKTDYIHVRARRGQATDSHSLAERVRRERISRRMKYLQELVPGCHKITGKAGMLDEIINYVQSLQRQVEFLSMKLATINPQLNFSIESLFEKEVFQPCTSSYPTLGSDAEMNPAYTQSSHLEVVSTGIDWQNYQSDMRLQMQLTETYADTNTYNQINQNYSTWDAKLNNLFSTDFQARSATYPSQIFTGSTEASNLKMEI